MNLPHFAKAPVIMVKFYIFIPVFLCCRDFPYLLRQCEGFSSNAGPAFIGSAHITMTFGQGNKTPAAWHISPGTRLAGATPLKTG
jgi:hypothetical protein